MPNVPGNPDPTHFDRDVALVLEALQLLRTRDGLAVTDDQLLERARNAIASLRGEYAIVRIGVLSLGSALGHLDAASAILIGIEGSA
jgi:hypothetical protein